MTNIRSKLGICFLAILLFADILAAQQKSSSPSASSPSTTPASSSQAGGGTGGGGGSPGTYSIEGEIFAYKSLQSNGKAIAQDVATLIPPSTSRPGIVIVPSASVILPAFQLWRSNMLVIHNFLDQTDATFQSAKKAPCPTQNIPKLAPSFEAYATGVTQAVGVIQSILGLFASSQTVTDFSGTIQDQALIGAVARELRSNQVRVLAPDIYAPWMIDVATPPDSPFVSQLAKLINDLSRLQDLYQCNQLTLSVGFQLQQAEITRETDFAKLQDSSLKVADQSTLVNDIRSLTEQIRYMRLKLGLTNEDFKQPERDVEEQERILLDSKMSAIQKKDALNIIKRSDAATMALENPFVTTATLTAAKAQSLVTGIQAYLAGLTGGAISFTPPSGTTSAASAAPATGAGGGSGTALGATAAGAQKPGDSSTASAAATQTPPGSTSASASPTVSSPASSTPPIVTILQADGLARKMNVQPDEKNAWNFNNWRVLWVKSMESGGAIVTKTNIWGSKPYFSGGAVSGYALFQLDGNLICSGNAAAYGGYAKPEDFVKRNSSVGAVEMLNLGSGCKPDGTQQ